MFLEDKYWEQACENLFWYNLAMLSAALFKMTDGLVLTEIRGDRIRFDGVTSIPVIDIEYMKTGVKTWKVRKPINIPVVQIPVEPR